VILGLASSIEHHVDPGAHPRATRLLDATRQMPDPSGRERSHLAGVRLQLAAIRAVADELEHAFDGDSSRVPSSLVEQLAEELEHLARALREGDHP
jgi:hypothetical protein